MPGLLHFKISGDMPSDGCIQAILDGCHLLESFDLVVILIVLIEAWRKGAVNKLKFLYLQH